MKRIKQLLIVVIVVLIVQSSYINSYAVSEDIPVPMNDQITAWILEGQYNVCAELLMSICYQESKFTAKNISQITNRKWYKEGIEATNMKDINNHAENMEVLAYYMRKYAEEYPGEPELWVRMWNEGYENALKHPYKSTFYSRTIVERSAEWEELSEEYEGRVRP